MKVEVWGPNLPSEMGEETFHVHAVGCADTKRGWYPRLGRDSGPWAIEVDSVQEVVEDVYSDQMAENDDEWATWEPYLSDFQFFPRTASLARERVTA
jgi:hypothetical protein